MKKYQYISLVIVLILLIVVFYHSERPANLKGGELAFSSIDTGKVNQIVISGTNNEEIVLSRLNGNWRVNDNFSASPVAIDNFLFVIKRLRIKGIIDDESDNSDYERKRILIREGRREHALRYYALNNMELIHLEGSSRVFPSEVFGFPDLSLGQVAVADPDYWRDRLLCSMIPQDILSIEVQYPGFPEKDFAIIKTGGVLKLFNPVELSFYPESITKQESIHMFATYFMDMYFDDILHDEYKTDSILNLLPDMRVMIEGVKGDSVRLETWPLIEGGIMNERFVYLRKNRDREILIVKQLITDLWRKEQGDFLFQ